MLKETEETIVFFGIFLSLAAIQLGGWAFWPPSTGYAYVALNVRNSSFFSEKKTKQNKTEIFQWRHRDFVFFQKLELANTGCGTSIQFKNKTLQYFAILSDNNVIVAICDI